MRIVSSLIVALFVCGSTVAAAGTGLGVRQGTWNLRSQRTGAGNPPSFSPGLVMTSNSSENLTRLSSTVPTSIIGHDRMKFTVSADGRILTQESKGVDQKEKPYRYV